jgi:hydrogenase expression/formation protein HypE
LVTAGRIAAYGQPVAGKVSAEAFRRIIRSHLGAPAPGILVGPEHGVDAGVLDLGDGRVMALATDPFFVFPRYGWRRAAWFAVHIVASDACTTGLRPAYLTIDLNLPLAMTDDELAALWLAVDEACREIGLAVVTGHTGRYEGCDYPMLGGATVLATGPRDRYVTPAMARPGDALIVTKGAAIETTGMFGATFPAQLAAAIGPELARQADALFDQMSVVRDALLAVEVGVRDHGVTSLHDATERGVWGGLVEIAEASGRGLVVDQASIFLPPAVRAVCALFDLDPYSCSSEGTLLITCRPHRVDDLLDGFDAAGIPASRVGEITPAEEGIRVVRDGREQPLHAPVEDPFWPTFAEALRRW